jgi:hypothetical protein
MKGFKNRNIIVFTTQRYVYIKSLSLFYNILSDYLTRFLHRYRKAKQTADNILQTHLAISFCVVSEWGFSLVKFLGIEKGQDKCQVSNISLKNSYLLYYCAIMRVYIAKAKDDLITWILIVSNGVINFYPSSQIIVKILSQEYAVIFNFNSKLTTLLYTHAARTLLDRVQNSVKLLFFSQSQVFAAVYWHLPLKWVVC